MKKILACVLAVLFITAIPLSLAASGQQDVGSEKSEEQIVMRMGELNPESHPCTMADYEFARIVDEKSNGRIKVEVYASGQLGDQETMINQQVMGALDLYRTNPQFLDDFGVPKMKIMALPYIFRSVDHAWNVLNSSLGTEFLTAIDDADVGLIGIGWYAESARNYFFADKKVTSIDDMKGLKLRVPPSNMYMETTRAFGANPTPIAYSELYNALQTGVVDGAENPLSGYAANKFNEVAKYYTFDGHELAPSIILFSEKKWNKLSEDDQQLIRDAWKETEAYIRKITVEADKKIMEELKEEGVEFFEVENKQEWVDAVAPLHEKYGEGYEDLIARIKAVED